MNVHDAIANESNAVVMQTFNLSGLLVEYVYQCHEMYLFRHNAQCV